MSVEEILKLLHKSIKAKNYDIVPTVKNRNSRRKHGLTLLDIEDLLKDIDIPGEDVYIF